MFVLDFPYKTNKGMVSGGGAGIIVKQLCDALYDRGLDVSVVAGKLLDYKEEIVPYKVYRVSNILFGFRESKGLGSVLMTFKSFSLPKDFDIIHSHNPPAFLASYIFSKKIDRPNILTMHGPWADLRKSARPLACLIEKFCITHADAVVAVSHSLKKRLETKYRRKDILVVQNWVDTSIFKPISIREKKRLREEFSFGEDKFIVVYTGRFVREKRIEDILNSIPLVANKIKNALFLLVGGGFDQKIIYDWMKKKPDYSKHIRIIPSLPHDKVPLILNVADVFVLPSEEEGMSVSLLEAMASGLPCIVSDIPANKELINGKNGSFYRLGDVFTLSKKILECYNNFKLKQEFGKKARKTAMKFSGNDQINQYLKLYDSYLRLRYR